MPIASSCFKQRIQPGRNVIRPAHTAQAATDGAGGRSLALELMRASKVATSMFDLMRALVSLDPKRATLWLRRSGGLVSAFMTDRETARVVDGLAQALKCSRDVETARLLGEFLSEAPEYASAGALRQLVDVMDADEAAELLAPAFDQLVVKQTRGGDVEIEGSI